MVDVEIGGIPAYQGAAIGRKQPYVSDGTEFRLCFITMPKINVANKVTMLTGMLPSISSTTNETRKVVATIAAPENLVFLNASKTPPIS